MAGHSSGNRGYRRLATNTRAGRPGGRPGSHPATLPTGPQILIQPVNDQEQLPAIVRGVLRGLLPQLPKHVLIQRGRWVGVEQPGELRHHGGQKPLAVGVAGGPGQEVGHAVDLRRQRVHRLS